MGPGLRSSQPAQELSNLRPAQSPPANFSTRAPAGKFDAFMLALLVLVFCQVGGYAADFTQDEVGLWIAGTGGSIGRNANGGITEVNLTSTWITDEDLVRLASLSDLGRPSTFPTHGSAISGSSI